MNGGPARQQLTQPLYVLCDASRHMTPGHLTTANLLTGYLADGVTSGPLRLRAATRLTMQSYTDRTDVLLHLAPLDLADLAELDLPPLRGSDAEASIVAGLAGLRREMGTDYAQLEVDDHEVRSPLVVLITSGRSVDGEAEIAAALSDLTGSTLRADPEAAWQPLIVVLGIDVPDQDLIQRLVAPLAEAEAIFLPAGEDPAAEVTHMVQTLDASVASRLAGLRSARWVLRVRELGDLVRLDATADAIMHEVPDLELSEIDGSLLYQEFRDLGAADEHPYGRLLDLVAVGGTPEPSLLGLVERANWPHRMVVADDDPAAVRGVVVSAIPEKFTEELPTDAVLRAKLGRELAIAVEIAQNHRLELGREAFESVVFAVDPAPAVLLSRCDGVLVRDDPTDQGWRVDELAWLAAGIARLAKQPPGSTQPEVLDETGHQLLEDARSRIPQVVPTAEVWRRYLNSRFIDLQGPPVLTDVQVTPPVAPVGSQVTVRWRGRYADVITIIGPDGVPLTVPALTAEVNEGEFLLTMRSSGSVRVRSTNLAGAAELTTEPVHVFDLPTIRKVSLPDAPELVARESDDELRELIAGLWALDGGGLSDAMATATPVMNPDVLAEAGRAADPPSGSDPARPAATDRAPAALLTDRATFPIDVAGWFLQQPATPYAPAPAQMETPMGLSGLLASVAGGRQDVLKTTPSDQLRYAAMGGVIISTALVATVSAALAVHMALRLNVIWAIVIGLGWGLIIYNLDRLLVVQMVRQERKSLSVWIAVPRVVLAVILGAVISTPMVLQIFEPEINTELDIMHAEDVSNYSTNLQKNPDYASIVPLQQKIAKEQATVDSGVSLNVDAVPAVKTAKADYDKAQKEFQKREQDVVCEKEGTCGSGKSGAGIAYNEKVAIRDRARRDRDAAATLLQEVRARETTNLASTRAGAVAAAKSALAVDQAKLTELEARFDAEKAQHDELTSKDSGLLARLEALNRLSDGRPTLRTAHWALFLLFLAIELLPVLMKLLQILGPETAYERALKLADSRGETATRRRLDHDDRMELGRYQDAEKLDRYRGKLARREAKTNIDAVVQTQSEVMQDVLAAWREYATQQSADDLLDWQRRRATAEVHDPVTIPPLLPVSPPPGPAHDQVVDLDADLDTDTNVDSDTGSELDTETEPVPVDTAPAPVPQIPDFDATQPIPHQNGRAPGGDEVQTTPIHQTMPIHPTTPVHTVIDLTGKPPADEVYDQETDESPGRHRRPD